MMLLSVDASKLGPCVEWEFTGAGIGRCTQHERPDKPAPKGAPPQPPPSPLPPSTTRYPWIIDAALDPKGVQIVVSKNQTQRAAITVCVTGDVRPPGIRVLSPVDQFFELRHGCSTGIYTYGRTQKSVIFLWGEHDKPAKVGKASGFYDITFLPEKK